MTQSFTNAVASLPGSERIARAPFGGKIVIHATGEETGGAFGMWETFVPPGEGPAPHTHTRETEVFRVIRGVFRFRCGDVEFDAPAGSVVTLPPHIEHGWFNAGDEQGQMFGIVTPAGFEQLFVLVDALEAKTEHDIAQVEAGLGLINEATKALARVQGS